MGPLDIPPTADFDVKTGVAGEVHVVELETIETVQIVQTQPLRKEPAISPLPLTTLNTEKQSRSQGDELPQVGVEFWNQDGAAFHAPLPDARIAAAGRP